MIVFFNRNKLRWLVMLILVCLTSRLTCEHNTQRGFNHEVLKQRQTKGRTFCNSLIARQSPRRSVSMRAASVSWSEAFGRKAIARSRKLFWSAKILVLQSQATTQGQKTPCEWGRERSDISHHGNSNRPKNDNDLPEFAGLCASRSSGHLKSQ